MPSSTIINSHGLGVRIAEVYNTLGLNGSASLGQDLAYACRNTHGRTNIWARYKPLKVNTPADITDTQRRNLRFGLAFMVGDSDKTGGDTSPLHLIGGRWTYTPPGEGDFCRLTDWDGYHHLAPPPITPPGDITIYLNDTTATIPIGCTQIRIPQDLDLTDIYNFTADPCHPAIIIYSLETTGPYIRRAYISPAIIGGTTSVDITIPTEDIGAMRSPSAKWGPLHYLLFATPAEGPGAISPGSLTSWGSGRAIPLPAGVLPGGAFTFDRQSPITFVPSGIAQLPTAAHPQSIILYQPQLIEHGDTLTQQYFAVGITDSGRVALFGTLINRTERRITLSGGNIYADITPTLASASATAQKSNCPIYDASSHALLNPLTLDPGETREVAINLTGLPKATSSSPSRLVTISISFQAADGYRASASTPVTIGLKP